MKKQFANKKVLEKAFAEMEREYLGMSEEEYAKRGINIRLYAGMPMKVFRENLVAKGYDIENLTADGSGYNLFDIDELK